MKMVSPAHEPELQRRSCVALMSCRFHGFFSGSGLLYVIAAFIIAAHTFSMTFLVAECLSRRVLDGRLSGRPAGGGSIPSPQQNNLRCAISEFQTPLKTSSLYRFVQPHEGSVYAQLKASPNILTLIKNAADEAIGPRETQDAVGSPQEEMRNLSTAEMSYRSALALDPRSGLALDNLARVLWKQKKYAPAIRYWNQAVSLYPQNEQFQLSLALAFSDSGDTASSVRILQDLTVQHPDFEAAFFSLGSILCRRTDYSNGISAYRAALMLRPSDDIARKSLAKALLSSQQFAEGLQEIEVYIEQHPNDAEGHYLLGKVYSHGNEAEDAEREFNLAIAIDPQFPEAEYSLGAALLAHGREEQALTHLRRSVSLKPDNAEAHFQLSRAYRNLHRLDDARRETNFVQSLKQNETRNDRIDFLRHEAEHLSRSGKLSDAMSAYKEALEIGPQDARLLYDSALIADRLEDLSAENEYLTRAERSDNGLAAVHNQIAVLETRQGDLSHATIELNLALAIDPTYAEALSNLGVIFARNGEAQRAQPLFQRAIEINPDYEQAHMNLGLILASEGKLREAEVELQRTLQIDPANRVARRINLQIAEALHRVEKP